MNGLSLLALLLVAVAGVIVYRVGLMHGRQAPGRSTRALERTAGRSIEALQDAAASQPVGIATADEAKQPPVVAPAPPPSTGDERESGDPPPIATEKARLVRSLAIEGDALRAQLRGLDAARHSLGQVADERAASYRELADARGETARYRQIVVDIENNAPPPLLDQPGAPDDLKLIVGVGPVLERMLQQLGIATYRQIAAWSERDIDEFDARLAEFPGRIRRDAWVTQARELHMSKYGELPPRT